MQNQSKKLFIVDLHVHTLLIHSLFNVDLTKKNKKIKIPIINFNFRLIDLPRMKSANAGLTGFVLYPSPFLSAFGYSSINKQYEYFQNIINTPENNIIQIKRYSDLEQLHGKTGIFLCMEDITFIGNDLENVKKLDEMGIIYSSLVHFTKNRACRPAIGFGKDKDGGLTDFGKSLIKEFEKYNIILDLAHINTKGFSEAAKLSNNPVIVSHTGVKAIKFSYRNLEDNQIKSIADKGGIIGIFFNSFFLSSGKCSIDSIIDHIEYICNLVGDDYVSLGSDLDAFAPLPSGFEGIEDYSKIITKMSERCFSDSRISKITGENFLRVLKAVRI